MSEHMSITGECEFDHMPSDWEGGFAFCHHCKKVKNKLKIELHQGIAHDYIQCICPSCKKTIWVAELTNSYNEIDEKDAVGFEVSNKLPKKWKSIGDGRVIIKDNKICHVCKKPTNHYDCVMIQYNPKCKRGKYFCSNKCCNKFEKLEREKENNQEVKN